MNKIKPTNMVLCFCSLFGKNQSVRQKTCSHNCVLYTSRLSSMGSCMLVFCLGVLLIFMSSCSTSTHNPTGTPSIIANENNITGPSQSLLTPIPSVKQTQDVPHIRPARPYPDFSPNYLQFPPQWILNDLNNGNFALGGDSIAANYQVWHEFIGKVNKNKDAELTIQTFYFDSSKEVNDSTRYQKVDRYHLSVAGNQAVWKYLSDDKNDVSGKFSFVYDAETGLHEVFIGDTKVFGFIYFPSDLRQAALYFGYTPLEELPVGYASENAIKDGCLVIENGVIQNINVLTKSGDPFIDDAGYFIRIFTEDDEGITITDIGSYNERVCISVDYSRHSKRGSMEDMYITTYYDNYALSIGGGDTPDLYELALVPDFRESIFIFKDIPLKKD